MTTLTEWIETEARALQKQMPVGMIPETATGYEMFLRDFTIPIVQLCIQRFIGYDGAHAALMGHPKTLAAPLTIALMAKTAEEAADLTDPVTLIGVRRALDVVLAEHAQRREITLAELMEMTV